MAPRVYDQYGIERDWPWLQARYGNVKFLDAGTGQKFKLMRVDETEGPAVIKVRVLNEPGHPHANQPIANGWPDNELPDLRNLGLRSLWLPRAINQVTNTQGETGFGIGAGSYIRDLREGGPHTIWVLSPTLPSDGMSGIGMLGGTNHMGPLFLTFQIAVEVGTQPPPPPDPEPTPDPAIAQKLADIIGMQVGLQAEMQSMRGELQYLMHHLGARDGIVMPSQPPAYQED